MHFLKTREKRVFLAFEVKNCLIHRGGEGVDIKWNYPLGVFSKFIIGKSLFFSFWTY